VLATSLYNPVLSRFLRSMRLALPYKILYF